MSARLALYVTLYPQAFPYFADWFRSLRAQTDRDVDVWIGLDRAAPENAWELAGERFDFTPVAAGPEMSVAGLRQKVFAQMAEQYEGVIFTDPDDWMLPERVAQARADLERWDAVACAMRIVRTDGRDLGRTFTLPAGAVLEEGLLERNVFGLSNTAYRSDLLRRLLPIPDGIVLVDWLLAARAWALGARLGFQPRELMAYRQYEQNTARVLPPFNKAHVQRGIELVLEHYARMLAWPMLPAAARERLQAADARSRGFAAWFADGAHQAEYLTALNALPGGHIWWDFVAHPALAGLWNRQT